MVGLMFRLTRLTIFIYLFTCSYVFADFNTGEKIFKSKCSSCHGAYISTRILKDNFYNKDNKLLNLTVPTVNMLSYFLKEDSNHIGDKSDPELQKIEINEFVKDYLYKPNRQNSVISNHFLKYFDKKESMVGQVSKDEISDIVDYLFEYKDRRKKDMQKIALKNISTADILKMAKKQDKLIMVEAMSKTCFYCKKMEKEVFSKPDIQRAIEKDFLYIKIDIDDTKLPLGLAKQYDKFTPSFFILDKNGKLMNKYPGSWTEEDFKAIMKENLN